VNFGNNNAKQLTLPNPHSKCYLLLQVQHRIFFIEDNPLCLMSYKTNRLFTVAVKHNYIYIYIV